MSRRRRIIVDVATIVAVVAALAMAGASLLQSRRRAAVTDGLPPVAIDDWRRYGTDGRRIGPADAPVTIVEFGDYECPACRGAHPHLQAVLRTFAGDVALVYRHWPLAYHRFAYFAARAAECAASQGRFEEFHNLLYSTSDWLADPHGAFIRIADVIGIEDPGGFRNCLERLERVEAIEVDIVAARELGSGTPTVLVNEMLIRSFPDSTLLTELIEGALATAK